MLDSGTWSDFEAAEGGDLLGLVMREAHVDRRGALEWLAREGFLPDGWKASNYVTYSRYSHASQAPYSQANRTRRGMTPERSKKGVLHWLRRQTLPIADAPDHPIRSWMARRNLWHPEMPIPSSLRWIPFDSPVFRRTHSGVGAIAFPLAPISAWRASYPSTPSPTAVQLVCIDSEGERADYQNGQGRRVDKPKFGNARMAVWTIGDITGDSVVVCEGAADALALAARETDPVIATLTTPRPPTLWHDALSVFDLVTVWPDMDSEDERGRRTGLDAVRALVQARKLAGQSTAVMGVTVGKDPADAAREVSLLPDTELDTEPAQKG
jgi:hypothetical protein